MSGRISDADIALVRERSPIADVIGEHLQLRNAGGGNLKGLCPFHDEKTPSFNVTPARGLFVCFGCGKGGDVITFVQEIDHLSFAEAVERLAERAGVTLHYEGGSAAPRQQQGERTRLVAAHTAAAEFYAEQLAAPGAAAAREFLSSRGFDAAAAAQFGVGYSPQEWDSLVRHLRGRGFTDRELLTGGLAREGQRGPMDRFRGRLMWPIREITGDVVGFGARRLRDDDPIDAKYLNTAETPIYKKSTVLYGVDLAKKEIARRRQAVVVEGYTDVMACHLAGVPTAVATCGTSFGVDHIKVLRRLLMDQDEFRGEIIFTFDADDAGRKAALRANAFDQQFVAQTFVAIAPDGLDPCDLRLQRGEAAVRDVVASRVPMFEFVIQAALAGYDLETAEGRTSARRAGIAVVRDIRDVALRSEYARRLAGWLGLDDPNELVAEARGGVAEARRGRPRAETPGQGALLGGPLPATPAAQVEREALKLALQHPGLAGPVFDSIDKSMFTVPAYAAIRELIGSAGGTATAVAGEAWVAGLRDGAPDDAVRGLVTELAVEPMKTVNDDDPRYARAVLARLQELAFTRHAAELRGVLQRTNPEEQAADYNRLFADLIALDGRIKQLREEGLGGL